MPGLSMEGFGGRLSLGTDLARAEDAGRLVAKWREIHGWRAVKGPVPKAWSGGPAQTWTFVPAEMGSEARYDCPTVVGAHGLRIVDVYQDQAGVSPPDRLWLDLIGHVGERGDFAGVETWVFHSGKVVPWVNQMAEPVGRVKGTKGCTFYGSEPIGAVVRPAGTYDVMVSLPQAAEREFLF